MRIRFTLLLTLALALSADGAEVNHYRAPLLSGSLEFNLEPGGSPLSDVFVSIVQQAPAKPTSLQPQSRLEIIRSVSGEFAKVVKPIPGGKKGFKIPVGQKLNDTDLRDALRHGGIIANVGDTVQVTNIEFRANSIVIQVNGGGKKHFNWREHLQIGFGGAAAPGAASTGPQRAPGGTLVLDFGRTVPDMSADDLMTDLQTFLTFSKEQSAAVNWVDTLPALFKDAIKDRQAVVGMDHEMVLAALGRPDHKVRERDPNGTETEDWIYGNPPARTVFVTFTGDKVIRVKEFD